MSPYLAAVALLVDDYDAGTPHVGVLGFTLLEDTRLIEPAP